MIAYSKSNILVKDYQKLNLIEMTNKEREAACAEILTSSIATYTELRESYTDFINKGDTSNKEALLQFELRFNNLLGDLIPVSSRIIANQTTYNDKRASSLKSKIEVDYMEGDMKSQTKAKAYASASDEHMDFLADAIFWVESANTIKEMMSSIKSFINNITHYSKL